MSSSRPVRRSLAPALVTCAALAACSDAIAPDDGVGGAFTATLSGVVDDTLSGSATATRTPGPPWTLTMVTPDGLDSIAIVTREGRGRPGPGEYPLVDPTTGQGGSGGEEYLMAAVHLAPDAFPDYRPFDFLVGTLTITSSTPERVEGDFQLATSVTGEPARILVVRGSFTATGPPDA